MNKDNNSDKHKNHRLNVSGLHIHYDKVCAIRDVSFDLCCGSSLAVIGANGAGKSTLLKALAGLLKPAEGEIFWRSKPMRKSSREIAYLPQREDVDWRFPLTVRGLVEMGRFPYLGLLGSFTNSDQEIVDNALEQLDLVDLSKRQINELSGGQQQRAFIARSLAQQSHVLLLDEPFNNLDRENQNNLALLIKKLRADNRLIIVTCHDMEIVKTTFDYILKLDCNLEYFKKNEYTN